MKAASVVTFIIIFCSCISSLVNAQRVNTRKWYSPDFVVAQYAGSIGFLSIGTGYTMLNDKATIDVLFGYVPNFTGSKSIRTITLKFTGIPMKVAINKNITWYPVTTGVYFSYTLGKEYSSDLPSWYPEGYYWWSEAIRANVFIGGAAKIMTEKLRSRASVTPYYEVGTNEIKLVSYFQNGKSLNFSDILHVGIGVRYQFGK